MRREQIVKFAGVVAVVAGLSACSDRDITLHELRLNDDGPEEFSIVPAKPLETPENTTELPIPTPGGKNRTDLTPEADAVAALGGDSTRVEPRSGGVSRGDGALVNHASRYGRQGDIRQTLADEDLEFRKRQSLFTWSIQRKDEYYDAYRRMAIDPYYILRLFRKAGVRTPSASPPGYEE